MPPTMRSKVAINGDDVMTDPIASAASATLSANTSLTTRQPKSHCRWRADKMGAMRRPERLAPGDPPQQRDRGVGQIVERQQQCGRELLMKASCNRHQPSSSPIGRLPTSPRKIFATGRLNGENPSSAPHSAAATMVVDAGISPSQPSRTTAAVTGTASATVIRSSPSMKLTRLTNQRPASRSRARSIQSGSAGTTGVRPARQQPRRRPRAPAGAAAAGPESS